MSNNVAGVYNVNNSAATTVGSSSNNAATLSMNDFFTLLVAEMQNQDALNPTSNTEFISQMATFSTLQQLQNLQASFNATMSVTMIGKEVTGVAYVTKTRVEDNQTYQYIEKVDVKGTVDSVSFVNGEPVLMVGGQQVKMSDITTVK